MLPYQSSRGCPHRCAFCINPTIGNSLWRTKSTKKIVDEVEILVKNYNLDAINFVDDNFFVNRQRVIEICKEIIRRNLVFNWVAECRADYFGKIVDDNLLDLAVKAGLNGLTIGFESGSPRILRLIKKDITIQDSLRAVKMCVKHNIEIDMAFMIGIPGETKKDVEQTLSLINEFKQICPNSRVGLSVFRIYPGNELSKKIFRTGLLEEPKSLRDWCDPKYQAFYTTGFADDKWVENISFYYQLATSNLPQTFSAIKKGRLLFLPRLFFIMLAKQRVKKSFFDITLDKFLYNKAFNFYLNMREKLNRFNR